MKYLILLGVHVLSSMVHAQSMPSREIDDLVDLLEVHIAQLQQFHEQHKLLVHALFGQSEIKLHSIINMPFNHNLIKWCIKTMERQKNLAPLFDMWETFKSYRYVEGLQADVFIRECALLIFVIYNNILLKISPHPQRVNSEEINALFSKIALLPIRDLIDVLNKIRIELMQILSEYPLKPHQTVLQWIKENWWVPPTVIAGIIVAIIFKQQ